MSNKEIYTFTIEELRDIKSILQKYPRKQAALLPVLWFAQDKFGHIDTPVQHLVAETLEIPYAHVHGVATFYTQFYKTPKGKHVLDVCTCLTCQATGGYEILEHLEKKLGIKAGETTADGMFSLQSVECLGACGYAPVLQVTNNTYLHHLTPEKADRCLEDLKKGEKPKFEAIPLPQHHHSKF